jgi:hypothetical protein
MKRLLLICLTAGVAFGVFAQKKEAPTEVVKNKFEGGLTYSHLFNTAELPVATTSMNLPMVKYYLETVQQERNKFYLTGTMAYNMNKTTVDGKVDEGADNFASDFYLLLDPQIRFYIPKETFSKLGNPDKKDEIDNDEWQEPTGDAKSSNKFFFSMGLPIEYHNVTPQHEEAKTYTTTIIDMTANFGYDDKQVDIKKLSPYAKFQKGLFAYALFEYRLTESYDGESPDEMPMKFGIAADYATNLEKWVPNAMFKPFFSLKYQMKSDAIRIFPWEYTRGYVGTYLDISFGAEYAQDITKEFNLTALLSATTWQLDDEDKNSINSMKLCANLNYYPKKMPELNVFGGMGMEVHLKEEDKTPEFTFKLGALYTFDFLKVQEETTDFDF